MHGTNMKTIHQLHSLTYCLTSTINNKILSQLNNKYWNYIHRQYNIIRSSCLNSYFPKALDWCGKRKVPIQNNIQLFNSLDAELNPTCYLLALLGAHHILHVSRIRVNVALVPRNS